MKQTIKLTLPKSNVKTNKIKTKNRQNSNILNVYCPINRIQHTHTKKRSKQNSNLLYPPLPYSPFPPTKKKFPQKNIIKSSDDVDSCAAASLLITATLTAAATQLERHKGCACKNTALHTCAHDQPDTVMAHLLLAM